MKFKTLMRLKDEIIVSFIVDIVSYSAWMAYKKSIIDTFLAIINLYRNLIIEYNSNIDMNKFRLGGKDDIISCKWRNC